MTYLVVFVLAAFVENSIGMKFIVVVLSFFLLFLSLWRKFYFRQPWEWFEIIGYASISLLFISRI